MNHITQKFSVVVRVAAYGVGRGAGSCLENKDVLGNLKIERVWLRNILLLESRSEKFPKQEGANHFLANLVFTVTFCSYLGNCSSFGTVKVRR